MKKGFVPIIIIFLVLAVVGGGVVGLSLLSKNETEKPTPISTKKVDQETKNKPLKHLL